MFNVSISNNLSVGKFDWPEAWLKEGGRTGGQAVGRPGGRTGGQATIDRSENVACFL